MNVGPRVSPDVSLNQTAARVAEPKPAEHAAAAPPSQPRVQVGDRVELSYAARTLSEATSLTDEQVDAIRGRIASGAYDDPRVIEVVARRILARGDV
jgi:hypothetical protein